MTLADDQAHLLHALLRNRVDFVVVGGVAAQLRGWTGATTDLDIAVASEESNTTRINHALAEVGLMKTDVGGLGTSFETTFGRLEIVRRADGIGFYDDWMRNATEMEIDDLLLREQGVRLFEPPPAGRGLGHQERCPSSAPDGTRHAGP
jgi:hypothetical protein